MAHWVVPAPAMRQFCYETGILPELRSLALWGVTVKGLMIWKLRTASGAS